MDTYYAEDEVNDEASSLKEKLIKGKINVSKQYVERQIPVQKLRVTLKKATRVVVNQSVKEEAELLKQVERMTMSFFGFTLIGLTIFFFYVSRVNVIAEQFDSLMTHSIETAVLTPTRMSNVHNDAVEYYLPKSFEYGYSHGVNDVLKFQDHQLILHYNEEYSAIGQDEKTYTLLREENQLTGEEVYYQQVDEEIENGFIQVVQVEQDYLVTVFMNGVKVSTLVAYEQIPYLTYNMLVMSKSVKPYSSVYTALDVSDEAIADDTAKDEDVVVEETLEIVPEDVETTEGELKSTEGEQLLEFDFSSDRREKQKESGS